VSATPVSEGRRTGVPAKGPTLLPPGNGCDALTHGRRRGLQSSGGPRTKVATFRVRGDDQG
jgi:hypothetical protein